MKFIIALSAFAVSALAQSTTSTAAPAPTLSPTQVCLSKCAAGDVTCQAICVGVPHPGETQMNDVTNCVAKCDQGDGSTAASDKYRQCQDTCISSYIVTSGTAVPGGSSTGSSKAATNTASGTGSAAAAAGTASSGSSAGASSASASASAKANAGTQTAVSGGLLSLVFGAFAALL